MEVRSEYNDGKLLFEWNPAENIVGIVRRGIFYRIKLIGQDEGGGYRVLEEVNKRNDTKNK